MTNLIRVAALAALLAISSAHAEENAFKHQDDVIPSSYSASEKAAAPMLDSHDQSPSVDSHIAPTPAKRSNTLSPFAWVAEKVIIAMASAVSTPVAGHALTVAH
jgi:hypothetical protein